MGKIKKKEAKTFFGNFINRFQENETLDAAATLAYYFLLSLFPLLIFTFSILPYVGVDHKDAVNLLQRIMPDDAMKMIQNNLDHLFSKNGGLLSIGVLATLWPASNAINALIRALNRAYEVKESRSFIVARLMAIFLTIAMIIVIVITLVINVFGPVLGKFISSYFGLSSGFMTVWNLLSLLVSFIIVIIVFACLYLFAPNKRLKVKEVIVGSVTAAVGWQVASYLFSVYVSNFANYSNTYGTLGGIIILMLWFYITALIIVLGGEINATFRYLNKKRNGIID